MLNSWSPVNVQDVVFIVHLISHLDWGLRQQDSQLFHLMVLEYSNEQQGTGWEVLLKHLPRRICKTI